MTLTIARLVEIIREGDKVLNQMPGESDEAFYRRGAEWLLPRLGEPTPPPSRLELAALTVLNALPGKEMRAAMAELKAAYIGAARSSGTGEKT